MTAPQRSSLVPLVSNRRILLVEDDQRLGELKPVALLGKPVPLDKLTALIANLN